MSPEEFDTTLESDDNGSPYPTGGEARAIVTR